MHESPFCSYEWKIRVSSPNFSKSPAVRFIFILQPWIRYKTNKSHRLVDSQDSQGCLPIHWASKHGKTGALPHLIPTSSVDAEDNASGRWTPLHYAASSNKLDACKWLLENGANKEKKDAHGRTPREVAEEHSFVSIVSLLK